MRTELEIHHPRDKAIKGIICGIPTFGMIHAEFVMSCVAQAIPINFGMSYIFPGYTPPLRGMRWSWKKNKVVTYREWLDEEQPITPPDPWTLEIGEARNMLADFALASNVEWLFFRDDDTVAAPDCLNKLFHDRLEIVSGHYPSKGVPPDSIILQDGYLAGYEDWRLGEIVECTFIGMGCTLIHTDVLRKIEKEVGRPWFKTLHSMMDNDIQELAPGSRMMTEDVYFCLKARKAGYKVYCDTGAQAYHLDVKAQTKHYYNPAFRTMCWEDYNGATYLYPPAGDWRRSKTSVVVSHYLDEKKNDPNWKETPRPRRVEVGCPKGCEWPGFITVDLCEKCDRPGDARDLDWLIQDIGLLDEIRASHILEHIRSNEVVQTVHNWRRSLYPGGILEIAIPDFDWASEWAMRKRTVQVNEYWSQLAMVYGAQRSVPDMHRTPFNMKMLYHIADLVKMEVVDSFYMQVPDARVQRSCIIVLRKPLVEGEESAQGVRTIEEIRKYYDDTVRQAASEPLNGMLQQAIVSPSKNQEIVHEQLQNIERFFANGARDGAGDSGRAGGNEPGQAQGHGAESSAAIPAIDPCRDARGGIPIVDFTTT